MRTFAIVLVLALAVSGDVVHARTACETKCDDWVASCMKSCADAPAVDECKANCRTGYDKCLSDCGPPPDQRSRPGESDTGSGR